MAHPSAESSAPAAKSATGPAAQSSRARAPSRRALYQSAPALPRARAVKVSPSRVSQTRVRLSAMATPNSAPGQSAFVTPKTWMDTSKRALAPSMLPKRCSAPGSSLAKRESDDDASTAAAINSSTATWPRTNIGRSVLAQLASRSEIRDYCTPRMTSWSLGCPSVLGWMPATTSYAGPAPQRMVFWFGAPWRWQLGGRAPSCTVPFTGLLASTT